ncbi:MAG: di-trans,poly-cis-decaprenylcistransferase [Spirochaetes bacterium GWF1_51_8]|nr:MAG: di-trans,poly-cis-decaprenylcistransferase [Spirochaetes bacterium GWF1_51_8]
MRLYGHEIDPKTLPGHVGIIMDGNGRWAKAKGLSRSAGHEAGFRALDRLLNANKEIGVKVLTFYAFSTENWKRPAIEVKFLMAMAKKVIVEYLDTLMANDIRFVMTGTFEGLSSDLRDMIQGAMERSRHCKSYILNMAFNYGGRKEIIDAVRRIAADSAEKKLKPDTIDDKKFAEYLYSPGIPDPDLIIRTSGELRLSNFLLWESAYSELWFTKKLWPDFHPKDFCKAIFDFQHRKRRFGKV